MAALYIDVLMRLIFFLLLQLSVLQADLSMEEFDHACSKLKWLQEGHHELPQSGSELAIPEDHILLTGKDAILYRNLIDCIAIDGSIEAVLFSKHEPYDSVIFKSYHQEGYIPSNDWAEMNDKALMAAIMENTEEANCQRQEQGIEERIEVLGWLKAPEYNPKTNTVYWAIEASQGSDRIANSVALKLSRHGYEQLTWVTPKVFYKAKGGELDLALHAHQFPMGDRYEDYVSSDKMAPYGIAGLVASVAGAKVAQDKEISSVFLLIKKFAGFIAAACIVLFYSAVKFLKQKKESKPLMRES